MEISLGNGRPTLVNLWASWCAPCSHELAEWHARQIELKAAGVHVVAISVDQLESKDDSSADAALRTIREIAPSLEFGFATEELYTRLQQAHDWPFSRRIPMPVPTSFLIDGEGRLTVLYRGTVSARQVISDTKLFKLNDDALLSASLPFPGQWMFTPKAPAPMFRGIELMNEGDVVDAAEFAIRNIELLKPHREFPLLAIWISEKLMASGDVDRGLLFLRWAAEGDSSNIAVVNNLAWQLAANPSERVRNPSLALKWAEKANSITGGKHPAVLDTVAVAHAATGDFAKAIQVIELGIQLASASGDVATASSMQERLRLFEAGKPYLESGSDSK